MRLRDLSTRHLISSSTHEAVNNIAAEETIATLTMIIEQGQNDLISEDNFGIWQGHLSNHDEVLKSYLIEKDFYNETNADIAIRLMSQDEVAELIYTLDDANLTAAAGAVAATSPRSY